MSWWDDITSVFSSDTSGQQTSDNNVPPYLSDDTTSVPPYLAENAVVANSNPLNLSLDMGLSNQYTLRDLTLTNQALSEPNLPSEQYQVQNLGALAEMLERLTSEVGPFTLISAFRTPELEKKLGEQGNAISLTLSFHEVGRAIDIAPTTMSLADYFGRILANDALKSSFAEISIKPNQGSLHLSINVPGDVRTPKILGLDQASNSYVRLTGDQIASYVQPFMASAEEAIAYADELASSSVNPVLLLGAAALVGAFFMFKKPRKVVS